MTLYEKMLTERDAPPIPGLRALADRERGTIRARIGEPRSAGRTDDDLIEAFEMSEAEGYVLSVVTGEPVEPDHPDSPLRRAGCI